MKTTNTILCALICTLAVNVNAQSINSMRQGDNKIILREAKEFKELKNNRKKQAQSFKRELESYKKTMNTIRAQMKEEDLSQEEREEKRAELMEANTRASIAIRQYTKDSIEAFEQYDNHLGVILDQMKQTDGEDMNRRHLAEAALKLGKSATENANADFLAVYGEDIVNSDDITSRHLADSSNMFAASVKYARSGAYGLNQEAGFVEELKDLRQSIKIQRNNYARVHHLKTKSLQRNLKIATYNNTKRAVRSVTEEVSELLSDDDPLGTTYEVSADELISDTDIHRGSDTDKHNYQNKQKQRSDKRKKLFSNPYKQ